MINQIKELRLGNGIGDPVPIAISNYNNLEIVLPNETVIQIELFSRDCDDRINISARAKNSCNGVPTIYPVAGSVFAVGVSK